MGDVGDVFAPGALQPFLLGDVRDEAHRAGDGADFVHRGRDGQPQRHFPRLERAGHGLAGADHAVEILPDGLVRDDLHARVGQMQHGLLPGEQPLQRGIGVGYAALVVHGHDALTQAVQHVLEAVALEDQRVEIARQLGGDVVQRLGQLADLARRALVGTGLQIAVGHGHRHVAQLADGPNHGQKQRLDQCPARQRRRGQSGQRRRQHAQRRAALGGREHGDQRRGRLRAARRHRREGVIASAHPGVAQTFIALHGPVDPLGEHLGYRADVLGQHLCLLVRRQPCHAAGRAEQLRRGMQRAVAGLRRRGHQPRLGQKLLPRGAHRRVPAQQKTRWQADGDRRSEDDRRKEEGAPNQHALFFHALTSNR